MAALDLDLLRTFACVADARNFTAAGRLLGATQSAVSLRIQKLEAQIGRALLRRTPREVALTEFGEGFLVDARRLLSEHDAVLRRALGEDAPPRLTLGISDHAAGDRLPDLLGRLRRAHPEARLSVTVGFSDALDRDFAAGQFDAVVIACGAEGGERGEALRRDPLRWFAPVDYRLEPDEPVPLVSMLSETCQVRNAAMEALDRAGRSWVEIFRGGGVSAVQAAVSAGIGVACLDARNRPARARILGAADGMPDLPDRALVMLRRRIGGSAETVLDLTAEAFRT